MPTLKPMLLATLLVLGAGSASAQSTPELRLPETLDRTFRDMMESMKPAIDDAFEAMRNMTGIDDPRNYEMPEILPNGDIILRRRPDAPEYVPPVPDEAPAKPADPEDGSVKT